MVVSIRTAEARICRSLTSRQQAPKTIPITSVRTLAPTGCHSDSDCHYHVGVWCSCRGSSLWDNHTKYWWHQNNGVYECKLALGLAWLRLENLGIQVCVLQQQHWTYESLARQRTHDGCTLPSPQFNDGNEKKTKNACRRRKSVQR